MQQDIFGSTVKFELYDINATVALQHHVDMSPACVILGTGIYTNQLEKDEQDIPVMVSQSSTNNSYAMTTNFQSLPEANL